MKSKAEKLFTGEDVWHGGHYGLCFELPEPSEKVARNALAVLWSAPNLEGCYLRNDLEPNEQRKISPLNILSEGHKYGIASFPNKKYVLAEVLQQITTMMAGGCFFIYH